MMEQHDRSKPMAIGCNARQTLVVLAHSYDHLPVEYVRGLSKCQVIGNSLEVTAGFSLVQLLLSRLGYVADATSSPALSIYLMPACIASE